MRANRLLCVAWLLVGCTISSDGALLGGSPGDLGGGVGDECADAADCRAGLVCGTGDTCKPSGATAACDVCLISAECQENLGCAPNLGQCPAGCEDRCQLVDARTLAPTFGFCVPRGEAQAGEPCSIELECDDGLYCRLVGFAGVCAPGGAGDIGDDCQAHGDCLPALWCSSARKTAGTCQPLLRSFDPFEGVACAEPEAEFRAYFEVDTQNDFYRLPFPNDALVGEDGRLDLASHLTPGPGLLGVDIVRAYFDRIGEEFDGFSPLAPAYFRFSRGLDFGSLEREGDTRPVRLYDITPDAPELGQLLSLRWLAGGQAGNFICGDYVAVGPLTPLLGGHTYAAFLTTDVRSDEGVAVRRDADFAAVLDEVSPDDARLMRAWQAYAPLRAWLATTDSIAADQIASAAVFTVRDATRQVARVADAVRAAGPEVGLVETRVCDGMADPAGTECPCESGVADAFTEVHGKVVLPVVQEGERPYLDSGGAVDADSVVRGAEEVCFALAVPTAGASPLPVVVYGHGTGGSFTSGMGDVASTLATRGIATLSFTGVLHDERRGGSDLPPDVLFFNFLNPEAARGNVLQGAADVVQVVRTLRAVGVTVDGAEVTFDPERIYYFGHSQGATTGGLAVPFDPGVPVAVLSGAGGHLVETLTHKTSPVDIPAAVEFVLGEPPSRWHPVLNLLQTWFDPVDLVNFGAAYFQRPAAGMPPRHVLMTYGLGDTFTPPQALGAFARALRASPVEPVLEDYSGPASVTAPVIGNYTASEPAVTAVLVQADPGGEYDGHFVATQDEALRERWASFLTSAVTSEDGTPTLPCVEGEPCAE